MDKKSKGKTVLIVFLILIIIGLGGYLVYDKVLNTKNEPTTVEDSTKTNESNIKAYDYNNIKGLYTYKGTSVYSEANDGNITPEYKLYLYENGMFFYDYAYLAGEGKIGNYIIANNTIILNNLFDTHSDVSLTVIDGTNTLTINEDGSLTDNNQPVSIVNEKTITLKKSEANANYQDVQNKFKSAFTRQ